MCGEARDVSCLVISLRLASYEVFIVVWYGFFDWSVLNLVCV